MTLHLGVGIETLLVVMIGLQIALTMILLDRTPRSNNMALVADELAKLQVSFATLQTNFNAMQTRVANDIASLKAGAGVLTSEHAAAFDALNTGLVNLATAVAAVDPPPAP